jgi:hypothetical protein
VIASVSFEAGRSRYVTISASLDCLRDVQSHVEGYLRATLPALPGWNVTVLDAEPKESSVSSQTIEGSAEEGRILVVDPSASSIALYVASKEEQALQATLVLTDLCRWETASRDVFYLHATAVEVTSAGLVLLGSPRSGKTNLALAILNLSGGDLIGDNNISIERGTESVARGWPTPLTFRRSAYGFVQRVLPAVGQHAGPNSCSSEEGGSHRSIVTLFPDQLRRLGVRTRSTTVVRALVFPQLSYDRSEDAVVARIDTDSTEEELLRAWDVIPERKPGVDAQEVFNRHGDWSEAAFHKFTLESFRAKIPELERSSPAWLARTYPSYLVRFGEDRIFHAAGQLIHALTR